MENRLWRKMGFAAAMAWSLGGAAVGCDAPASGQPPAKTANKPAKAPAAKAPAAKTAEAKPPEASVEAAPVEAAPVEAAPVEAAPGENGEALPAEPTPAEPAAPAPAEITNIRDAALVPPNTPAANIKAFTRLPIAKGDKAPLGGVGANGIHLDELEVGRGWDASRCDLVGSRFTVGVDERVNICMRVIHPRESEGLVIYWLRDGKQRQRSKVEAKAIHAYLTRGWLPITEDRKGTWTARIETADKAVIGSIDFTIE